MYGVKADYFHNLKRGAYTSSLRFCEEHKNFCELFDYNNTYIRIIHRSFSSVAEIIKNDKDLFFINIPKKIQQEIVVKNNVASCGFSFCKQNKIKNFIPFITNFRSLSPEKERTGIYFSKHTKPNTKFLIKEDFKDALILGDKIEGFEQTYDSQYFFNNITHYVHIPSEEFYEVMPQSLLEAIMSDKQIMIPKTNRTFFDGIDDIKSCINFSEDLHNEHKSNEDSILRYENFERFYNNLFKNNFESITGKKYNNFYDWCVDNI